MKLFFLLSLISISAFAQIDVGTSSYPCTEADLISGGNVDCGTLTINSPVVFNSGVAALNIRVKGNVSINQPINLSGSDSLDDGSLNDFFGEGGPGADNGGNTGFGNPQSAAGPSGGGLGGVDVVAVCGAGGGGGGFLAAAPAPGNSCGTANGGTAGPSYPSVFSPPLRGGFGGGAGGDNGSPSGGGGGGGGAIHIRVGGDVIINAAITANGGNGGPGFSNSGGGGGGSGGLIWIEALGTITNTAALSATGGNGGTSTNTGSGSAGAHGEIRIESINGTVINSGSLPPYTDVRSNGTSAPAPPQISENLNSSISCGSVKPNKNHAAFVQFVLSLMAVIGLLQLSKKSSKFFS